MNTKHIETLIGRYFNGETNLQEEQLLRTYFQQESLPEHLSHLKALFALSAEDTTTLSSRFDHQLMQTIQQQETAKRKRKNLSRLTIASSAAAIILLFYSVLTFLRPAQFEDTFNDPTAAYEQASDALLFVSGKLSRGMQPAREASQKLDQSVEEVSRIKSLNKGIDQILKLNKIDEISNIVSFR